MNDFDRALEDCLDQLSSGASTLDECLARYPAHAARLRPLLQAAARLERGRDIRPSPAFKARARARLTAHMQTHPRRRGRTISSAWRLAIGLAALTVVFLITGTAFAQGALPGDELFSWKLASEQVWRTVSPDPVAVDLKLTQRRAEELLTVSEDPYRSAQALDSYRVVLARLAAEGGTQNDERIGQVLKSQQEAFSLVDISVPELDAYLSRRNSLQEVPLEEKPNPDPPPEILPPPLP